MGILDKWRMKRIIKIRELARIELQSRCPHDWRYLGTKDFDHYNGYDIDIDTYHIVYCPYCEKEERYETKNRALQEVMKSELRKETEL